ncbi:MAG: Prepilin-type N-terminal cleavage/methylation protein, partial [Verrucomicrobia bacterium]|nr:Prepilin-type N-terminal cleavage/methylation protein [Verrucomicrobiota bacterium]
MSTIDGKIPGAHIRGFTLVELLIATVLSAVVFVGIFSAYLFMARNLGRLANNQRQQTQNRNALYYVAKDFGDATQVTVAGASTLTLATSTGTGITYAYSSSFKTLVRTTSPATQSLTLLSDLTAFTFIYYPKSGTTALTFAAGLIVNPATNVRRLEMRFTTAAGSSSNGTMSTVP